MPRRKPKPEKQVEEKLKESLDSILQEENLDIQGVTTEDLPRLKSAEIMDFSEAKNATSTDAKSLLDNMVDFYLDSNIIGQEEHIEYKKKIDAMNLSSMLLQLKTAQHAIIKILEEIDMGNIQPRLFEVLAQLQSQIMQMPKDYQNYMDKMEESYKRLKIDSDQKSISSGIHVDEDGKALPPQDQSNSSSIKVRGTKGLMENLRNILEDDIEDVNLEDVEEHAIVNAKQKAKMSSKNPTEGNQNVDDSDSYEIDDELFD